MNNEKMNFLLIDAFEIAICNCRSLSLSSAAVASSRSKIRGFFNKARANAIFCLCPPLKFDPF
jgi:hypothetical protein